MTSTNSCMGIFRFDYGDFENIFDNIVKPLVQTHTELVYQDARHYYEPYSLKMELISRMIEEANLVIADVSTENANVFLELGIAYNLKKPIILLCSKKDFDEGWNKKLPFDLQGRELIIYEHKIDLKVKLGKSIFDSLYKTNAVSLNWDSTCKENIALGDRIEFSKSGAIWSTKGLNHNFIIGFHVTIDEELYRTEINPDIRFHISTQKDIYPRITVIFPWELSEIDKHKFECHIDYFHNEESHKNIEEHRLVQRAVAKRKIELLQNFDVFLSFCYPNIVFEATFFDEDIHRLSYPFYGSKLKGYPFYLSQFVGFSSGNRVSISNIVSKEIFYEK